MKKTVRCLLALFLSLSLALAGVAALALEAADVVGVWYLNALETGGTTMDPATLGLKMTLTLQADGSTVMEAMQAQDAGSWTLEGETVRVRDNESTLVFTLTEEGSLTGEIQGIQAIFGRRPVSEVFAPAPVVPAAALSDFDGAWTGTYMVIGTLTIPIDTTGAEVTASISAGRVSLRSVGVTGEDVVETARMEGTLEGGALVAPPESAGTELPMRMELHEDGTLSTRYQTDESEFLLYFQRTEPAA